MKKNNYACNGVRIALFLCLVFALAFLCISIVCLGVDNSNLALASISNGVVEDNLLLDNDFSINQSSSSNWLIYNANNGLLYSYLNNFSTLTNNTGSFGTYRQYLSNSFVSGNTLTLSCYVTSVTGTVSIYCDRLTSSVSSLVLVSGLNTFTITSTISTSNIQIGFNIQSNASFSFTWVKAELGSSFTGYVPLDYSHYGFDEGSSQIYSTEIARIKASDFTTNGALVDSVGSNYFIGNDLGTKLYKSSQGDTYGSSTLWSYDISTAGVTDNAVFYYLYIPFNHSLVKGSKVTITGDTTNLVGSSSYNAYYFRNIASGNISQSFQYAYSFVTTPYSTDVISSYLSNFYYTTYVGVNSVSVSPYGYLYGNSNYPSYTVPSGVNSQAYFYNNYGVSYGLVLRFSESALIQFSGDIVITTENISAMGNSQDELLNEYNKGYNNGYDIGYQFAVDNVNDYTFLGLFSAVIESPVRVISDSLDFELLGYNMKNFLFALLSIALILFIIKLFV